LEKNKPTNKAISPLLIVKPIIPTQPVVGPKIILQIKLKTMMRALHAMKGAIRIEMMRSFLLDELRDIMMAGTLQPKPVNKFTTLLPLIPKRSNAWSNNTDTLEIIPTWLITLTKINKIAITGMKDKTANRPPKMPSTKRFVTHNGEPIKLNNSLIPLLLTISTKKFW
jgi:hypothetical protein